MDLSVPRRHGPVSVRLVRPRDARVLQNELMSNRSWLRQWEATSPHAPRGHEDARRRFVAKLLGQVVIGDIGQGLQRGIPHRAIRHRLTSLGFLGDEVSFLPGPVNTG